MNLSPKSHFCLSRKDEAEKLAELVVQPWFRSTLLHAYAEVASREQSTEFLRGAKNFADTLINLAEQAPTPESLPAKELKTLK